MAPEQQQNTLTAEPTRTRGLAMAGRLLIFLAVAFFIGFWTWFFVTA